MHVLEGVALSRCRSLPWSSTWSHEVRNTSMCCVEATAGVRNRCDPPGLLVSSVPYQDPAPWCSFPEPCCLAS